MNKKVFIAIGLITLQLIIAAVGMEVHDSAAIAGILATSQTATQQLNISTSQLGTLNDTYSLATQNSQALQVNNWNDISTLISEINAVANIPSSMTWAASSAVGTFTQLFPGDNKVTNYLNDMTQRTSGAINTFRGNLSAVQGLGDALNDYKTTLTRIQQAQSGVQGHLSAAEQSNQIQGNMLNAQQSLLMSQMAASSDASAYYAYEVQQKQTEIQSAKRFLTTSTPIDPTYKNEGTGDIPGM